MPKSQSKKTQTLSPFTEAVEKLLSEQTFVILKATDQKIDGVEKDMEQLLADHANVAVYCRLHLHRDASELLPGLRPACL